MSRILKLEYRSQMLQLLRRV